MKSVAAISLRNHKSSGDIRHELWSNNFAIKISDYDNKYWRYVGRKSYSTESFKLRQMEEGVPKE
jgi:hypothetical protein